MVGGLSFLAEGGMPSTGREAGASFVPGSLAALVAYVRIEYRCPLPLDRNPVIPGRIDLGENRIPLSFSSSIGIILIVNLL
ncbi:hypothetical protein OUZ56_008594 [Daphnia magna]|uniref:Uncharacterized protein n=1 Tax=Daphnia magna TaxID=35525 RepID=A0ABR0ADF5_9CRUS|nr:hypothetical protein OUZ56_008594 [Daphnia magna]